MILEFVECNTNLINFSWLINFGLCSTIIYFNLTMAGITIIDFECGGAGIKQIRFGGKRFCENEK